MVFFDKLNDFILHEFRRIFGEPEVAVGIRVKRIGAFRQPGARRNHFVVERNFFSVFPEVHREIGVRLALAVVAVEKVEALFVGDAFGKRAAKPPFAHDSGFVPSLLQQRAGAHTGALE